MDQVKYIVLILLIVFGVFISGCTSSYTHCGHGEFGMTFDDSNNSTTTNMNNFVIVNNN